MITSDELTLAPNDDDRPKSLLAQEVDRHLAGFERGAWRGQQAVVYNASDIAAMIENGTLRLELHRARSVQERAMIVAAIIVDAFDRGAPPESKLFSAEHSLDFGKDIERVLQGHAKRNQLSAYSTANASNLLGVKAHRIRRYAQRSKGGLGRLVGGRYVFSVADLDELKRLEAVARKEPDA